MAGSSWIAIGALIAGLAVGAGAFAAHGLKARLIAAADGDFQPREIFETAARYQMYHGLALLAVGLTAVQYPALRGVQIAGWSFVLGAILFSGSLYALALTGIRWLGAITPLGGLAFLVGWAALAISCLRTPPSVP
jgi:uncharacterized membrane protein YgdD (TMEM256/DUF423 family)